MKIVVIPATYNEKGNIERLITILEEEVFPKIKNHDMHILVADDNSPDGTADEVRKLMKKWKNLGLSSGEKKGLGAAYIRAMTTAFEKMKADVAFEIDADLSHDPHEIPNFLTKIDQSYDFVIGTRYSQGGSMPKNWPIQRKSFSRIANLLLRLITFRFSIHDWTGGYRAIKKNVFFAEREKVVSFQGYTFQVAFLYKSILDGFKVAEVPIHFADRTMGRSKIAALEYIVNLLLYIIIERIIELKRFVKFLIVGGTGFIMQILAQETSVQTGVANTIAQIISPIVFFITKHHGFVALRDASAGGVGAETAIVSNFLLNNFWTFQDTRKIKEKSPFLIRLIKFNLTSLASIFLQMFSIWVFVRLFGESLTIFSYTIPTRIVVVIPTIVFLVIPLNYLIYNKIIWKTQYLHERISTKK